MIVMFTVLVFSGDRGDPTMMATTIVLLGLSEVLLHSDLHGEAVKAVQRGEMTAAVKAWNKSLEGVPPDARTVELKKQCSPLSVADVGAGGFSPYLPLFIVQGKDNCFHICFGLAKKGEALPTPPERLRSKFKSRSLVPRRLGSLIERAETSGVVTEQSLAKYSKQRQSAGQPRQEPTGEEEQSGPKLPAGFETPPDGLTRKEQRSYWNTLRGKAYSEYDDAQEDYEILKEEIKTDKLKLTLPNIPQETKESIRAGLPAKQAKLKKLAEDAKKTKEAKSMVDSAAAEAVDTGDFTRP